MVDKSKCKLLFEELMSDLPDLDSATFRGLWYSRLEHLKELGCWYGYMIQKRQSRLYLGDPNHSRRFK